ncbi:O-antigen ligase family protein [Actinacidiphila sp. ITFR-21]|uniref:O-antigen ligase family protein n=1 Tax=Actinacidiphila sp. ITFR-21 TaxID=3075199 RepID=UPI00288B4FC1|nr:O-antigen ligase family protein [Streptomyces sp. ITFR-21]WNI19284.1 O-antigen ligase family protein [Streptomyces sp. ITFR-21]
MNRTADETPDTARTDLPGGLDPREVSAVRPQNGAVDAVGIAVLACCAVWVLIAAAGRSARPEGALLALLAVTAGYAAGRVLGAVLPVLAPAAGAVAVLALVLLPPDRVSARSEAPFLGYTGADAALLVLAAGAACCAAWAAGGRVRRTALQLVAVFAATAAFALGSAAGFAVGLAVVVCSLAAARMGRHRLLGLAGLALAAALAAGGSCALAADALPNRVSAPLTDALTRPRVELWHQAAALAGRHPLRGVGPERFADESGALPYGSVTPPAGTPRSAPLQLAAEQGCPGVALLAVAYGWLLCALWRSSRPAPVVLTAAAALTGLALLATADQVLSYAVVTAGAGFLAGIATARPLADDAGGSGDGKAPERRR